MNLFLAVLLAVFALTYGALAVIVLRRPLIGRIAFREVVRRPGQTIVIVAGLMIAGAAIYSTQFVLDSLDQSRQAAVISAFGRDDVEISRSGAYFDPGLAAQLAADPAVTANAAAFQNAIVAFGSVVDLDRNLGKPGIQVIGLDLGVQPRFGNFVLVGGRATSGRELASGDVFLTQPLAQAIDARVGDRLRIQAGGLSPHEVTVAGVTKREGAGAYGADRSIFGSLPTVQGMAGTDQVNLVRVSAKGDGDAEVAAARRMAPALRSVVAIPGLQVLEAKSAALRYAEQMNNGRPFVTSFGVIVALAAIAMVVNLAVMLAEERRPRLAVMRAMGLTRTGLVQLWVAEGGIYSLLGALAGLSAVLAIGLALEVYRVATQSVFPLTFSVQPASVLGSVAAAALINLVTFVIVSLRTSRMAISAAIRDLPDPERSARTSRLRLGLLALVALVGLAAVAAGQPPVRLLGGALVIAAVAGFARGRLSDRARYSAASAGAAAWAIAYYAYSNPSLSSTDQTGDFAAALPVTVIALSVLVAANLTLVEVAAGLVGRLSGSLRATLRPSLAYTVRRPLRSGLVIAAFSLVMATLIIVEALISANSVNYRLVSGGWDVRVAVVGSDQLSVPAALQSQVARAEVLTSRTFLGPVKWAFSDYRGTVDWHQEPVTVFGLSARQLGGGIMPLVGRDHRYGSDAAAWAAIAQDPGLVASADQVGSVVNLATDKGTLTFKVVAQLPSVLGGGSPSDILPGLIASEQSLAGLGAGAPGATMLVKAAGVTDPRALAHDLQRAVLAQGADATTVRQIVDDEYQVGKAQGPGDFFLLLLRVGLLVGVASLGAVALRAVVERRRSIGVLRAVGFQPAHLLAGMLLETAVVATAGLAVGIAVAYGLGMTLLAGSVLSFSPDPGSLLVTVGLVYAAVLLATLLPGLRAARLRPAEALRTVG
jgi:putative ABC transport system permease protein